MMNESFPVVTFAVMEYVPPPWYLTKWGGFGILMAGYGLIFGIMIGWGIHKNRELLADLVRPWIPRGRK